MSLKFLFAATLLLVASTGFAKTIFDGNDYTKVLETSDIDSRVTPGKFIEITRWNNRVGMVRTSDNPGVELKSELSNLALVERYCDRQTVQSDDCGSIKCFVRSGFGQ